MASLAGVCTQTLTYTPLGAINSRTGEVTPGAPVQLKGRFVRKQALMKNSQGEDTVSNAEAILLPDANPAVGATLEGWKIEAVEDVRDKTRLLGYRVKM